MPAHAGQRSRWPGLALRRVASDRGDSDGCIIPSWFYASFTFFSKPEEGKNAAQKHAILIKILIKK
jgi:hypothetical protein